MKIRHIVLLLSVVTMPLDGQSTTARPSEKPPSKSAKQSLRQPKLERSRNGGYLGIFFQEVRLERRCALEILSVQEGSDAARLGFQKGDKIVEVNGRRLKDGDEFIKSLWYQSRQRQGAKKAKNSLTVLREGEPVTIAAGIRELDRTPKVGDEAPGFVLKEIDGKKSRKLADMVGKKPIYLVFGSYT